MAPRVLARCLAVAAIVVPAGCGGGGDGPARPDPASPQASAAKTPAETEQERPPSDSELLARLLAERGAALARGSTRAFLATSTGPQVGKDRRQIRAARALPLTSVDLLAKGTDVSGDRATLRVEMSYAFDGIRTLYFKTSRITARRTAKGWRVLDDRPSAGALAPWEYTTYRARRSPHFLALAPRTLDVGSLMTDLEKGYGRMRRGLPGVKAPRRVLVIVARGGADTRALTKDIKTLSSLTAVAENRYATTGAAERVDRVWGQRIFVLWPSYANRSADERRRVITHELVHTALATRTSARTPPWLSEGIALYVSGDDRSGDAGALISGRGVLRDASKLGAAKRAMSLTRLSGARALDDLSPVSLSFAYAYASAAAYTIAAKDGRTGLLRLLSAYNSEKLKGKPGRRLTDRAVRRALGLSLSALEADVDAYASARSRF